MRELFVMAEVQSFKNFPEFVEAHNVDRGDIVLTNEPILPSFKKDIPEGVPVICTDNYGKGEPSDVMFEAIQKDASQYDYSRIIAVGGGSAIDIAKALCAADGRDMDELFAEEPSKLKKTKQLVCLPTTCGTGSEVTVTAVFDRTRKGTKMGITNYAFGTDYAVMIPELLESLPASVFGGSSIDALIHAIESYLNGAQSTIASKMFAEKAIRMILPVYITLKLEGVEARKNYLLDMQLASNFAGIAIANALPSASHAMGYPFAGKFHRPHGEACYVFLDVTMRKYLRDVQNNKVDEERKKTWKELMNILAESMDMIGRPDEDLLKALDELLGVMLTRKSLKEYGATPEDCIAFGKSCYSQQQRLMGCAFSPYSEQELIEAFQEVY